MRRDRGKRAAAHTLQPQDSLPDKNDKKQNEDDSHFLQRTRLHFNMDEERYVLLIRQH